MSSLIGRDLGDRGEVSGDRRDPPLQSAPMPRIDPADRAIFEPEQALPEPEADAPVARPMAQKSAPVPAGRADGGLGREHVRKLQSALDELSECRKLLDGALTRTG